MKCKKVLLRLSALQDGELSPQRSQELERHLETCATCRAEWLALEQMVDGLRRLTPAAPVRGFSSRVMAGLPRRPEIKLRLLPSLAYTLAVLMICISGFLLEVSANGQPATATQTTMTFSAVLAESRDLGLLTVQESTLELLSNLKPISLVKKQDNLLSKLLVPPLQGTSLRSRVSGDAHEK